METTQYHTSNNDGDYALVTLEDDDDETLGNSIETRFYNDSPLTAKCCVFRVPEVLRRHDYKVYKPNAVAIGPYHHSKPSLQPMEYVKQWYLRNLLSRLNQSRLNITMLSLVRGIKEFMRRARQCYQEPIDLDQNEFIEMMIIDGYFLIELFRKEDDEDLRSMDDPIFNMACMHQYLYHDLMLLENQLPWFILQYLFYMTMDNDQRNLSLTELTLKFFETYFSMTNSNYHSRPPLHDENAHILDLIRNVLISSFSNHQTDHHDDHENKRLDQKPQLIPCVTNLLEAGVKFLKGSPDNMMNIEFRNGVFVIPPLSIHETTEPMFLSLIAFEQCYHSCEDKITSYAILIDNLINSSKDMEYLSENEIIDN